MSRSDSKIDFDKYKPSVEDARRIADEEAAQGRLDRARDNPALDAALEHARGAGPKVRARVSKPSPWGKGATPGAERIDPAALPSATAPAVVPERARTDTKKGQRWWQRILWSHLLVAVVLALFPVGLVIVLFVRPQQLGARDGAGGRASVASPMATMSGASVAVPLASTGPSAHAVESAMPAMSATPRPRPSAAAPAPVQPTRSDDPRGDAGAAPLPRPTVVEPVPAPTADPHPPSPAKPPEAAPQPPASSSAGFQYFRKHD